jgi:hypothetical protein
MFRCLQLVAVSFAGVLLNAQSLGPAQGIISVRIVSTLGGKVSPGRLTISANGGRVYSADVSQETTIRLAYGDYNLDFTSRAWKPIHRTIRIDKPETFMTLGTDLESDVLETRGTPLIISAKVSPYEVCSPDGELVAKLVGVFSDSVVERKIGPYGLVKFDPVEIGAYVIIIVDGEHIRAVQAVRTVAPTTALNIALHDCKEE